MSYDEYDRMPTITLPEHSAPKVVETVEIEGQRVDIVQYATFTGMKTSKDQPVYGFADDFAAIVSGAEIRPLSVTFYANDGKHHKGGDVCSSQPTARPVKSGDELARRATVKAAIKGAEERIERDRLYATYAPVAEKNIASHTREQFEALDADAEIEPGDMVVVYSHKKYRTGVAIKVSRTRVECLAATPSTGVANGATRKKGEDVRLLRKANPTTPAVEESAPVEPRTPRGRWAAELAPENTPAFEAGLGEAAADFRTEQDARQVEQMRRDLVDLGVAVRGMSDVWIRREHAVRVTNRVADVDGRRFGPGALVECVGSATSVMTGWRGHAVAVGNDAHGDGQWVELDFVGREGGQVRSASRVRVINDYNEGAPVPADAPAQGSLVDEPTPAAAVPAAAAGALPALGEAIQERADRAESAGYDLAEPTADALRLLAQVFAAPEGTTAVFDGAGDVDYVQTDDEGRPGDGGVPLEGHAYRAGDGIGCAVYLGGSVVRCGAGRNQHPPAEAFAVPAPELDPADVRRAEVGRMFAAMEGMADAVEGCTLYRMVRARVGARQLRIHDAGGELLGTVTEVRAEPETEWQAERADGAALPARPGGLFASFADGVAAVRAAAASNQDDDQDATAAAQLGPDAGAAGELMRLLQLGRDLRLDLYAEPRPALRQYATIEELQYALSRPGAAATLRAIADQVERDQAGHVTEIRVDGGLFQWRCVQGDAAGHAYTVGEQAYAAATGHGPLVASSPFTRTAVIEHEGRGDNEHGVPRRMMANVLEWEPYDGGYWRLGGGRGSTSEIPGHDIAGAHAWAAVQLGKDDYDRPGVQVSRWEHHRDMYGEWWEPVTR